MSRRAGQLQAEAARQGHQKATVVPSVGQQLLPRDVDGQPRAGGGWQESGGRKGGWTGGREGERDPRLSWGGEGPCPGGDPPLPG